MKLPRYRCRRDKVPVSKGKAFAYCLMIRCPFLWRREPRGRRKQW